MQGFLAFPEARRHAGQRAQFHAAGRERHQVRGDPGQLHQQHPDHLRTAGTSMSSSFSTAMQYAASLNAGDR